MLILNKNIIVLINVLKDQSSLLNVKFYFINFV